MASKDTSVSPPHTPVLDELHFTYDDRHYRVRGPAENLSPQRLKLNVQVRRDGLFHAHLFDRQLGSQRRQFIRDASDELFVTEERIKHDLGQLLLTLETRQGGLLFGSDSLPQRRHRWSSRPPSVTRCWRCDATPCLLERIAEDFVRGGLVGATRGVLLVYLAGVSRLLAAPLAILIQSSSAAGKTTLMDHVCGLPPRRKCATRHSPDSRSTIRARNNWRTSCWPSPKRRASLRPATRSSCCRVKAACGSPRRARMSRRAWSRTQEYTVEGPVMLLLTTTAEVPDPELANRCLVLRVDESAARRRPAIQCSNATLGRPLPPQRMQTVR